MRTPFAALPLAIALLAGCTAMPQPPEVSSLDGTAWVLSALPGAELAAGAPATLRFEDGRAAGSDGCNRFTVGYHTSGTALEFSGRAASTRMACPPAITRQADEFMDALLGARTYRIEGGKLQLLSADGTARATLTPQSQALAGTGWRVTGINNGRGAVVSLAAGSTVTMAFAADGRAAGSAGCNRYTAGYESAGSRLRFTAPASTRRMCADETVMQQERNFLKALESVATVRIEADRLEMRDAGGSLMVSASREGG